MPLTTNNSFSLDSAPLPKLPDTSFLQGDELKSFLGDQGSLLDSLDVGSLSNIGDASQAASSIKDYGAKKLAGQTTKFSLLDSYKSDNDPMYQHTDPKERAKASAFKIDSLKGGLEALDPASENSQSLFDENVDLSVLSERLGQSLPGTQNGIRNLFKNTVSSFKNDMLGGLNPFGEGGLASLSPASLFNEDYFDGFKGFMKNLTPRNLLGKLSTIFDSSIPRTASNTGSPLAGLPEGIDPAIIASLKDVASNALGITLGDKCNNLPNDSYGFKLNAFMNHVKYLADEDIVCLLSAYLTNNMATNRSARRVINRAVSNASERGSSHTVATIVNAISPGHISNRSSLVGNLLKKGIKEAFNTTEISSISSTLKVPVLDLVSDAFTNSDNTTTYIYKEKDIRKYDGSSLDTVSGSSISSYISDRSVRFDNRRGIWTL